MRVFCISILWLLAVVPDESVSGKGYGREQTLNLTSVIEKAHGNAEHLKRLLRIKELEQLLSMRHKDSVTGDDQAGQSGTKPVNNARESSTNSNTTNRDITPQLYRSDEYRDRFTKHGHTRVSQINKSNEKSPLLRKHNTLQKGRYSTSNKKKRKNTNSKNLDDSSVSTHRHRGSSTHSKQYHVEMKGSVNRHGHRGSSTKFKNKDKVSLAHKKIHQKSRKKLKGTHKKLKGTRKEFKALSKKFKGKHKKLKGSNRKLKGSSRNHKGAKLKGTSKARKGSSSKLKGTHSKKLKGKYKNGNQVSKQHRKHMCKNKQKSRTDTNSENLKKMNMKECLKHVILNLRPNSNRNKVNKDKSTDNSDKDQDTGTIPELKKLGKDIENLKKYADALRDKTIEKQQKTDESGSTNVEDNTDNRTTKTEENLPIAETLTDAATEGPPQNEPETAKMHHASVDKDTSLLSDKTLWMGMAVGSGFSFVLFILCCCFYKCLLYYRSRLGAPLKNALGLFKADDEAEESPMHIKLSHKKGDNKGSSQYVVSIMGKKELDLDTSSEEEEVYNRSAVKTNGNSPLTYNTSTNLTPVKSKKSILQ